MKVRGSQLQTQKRVKGRSPPPSAHLRTECGVSEADRELWSAVWGCGACGGTAGTIGVWGGVVYGARPSLGDGKCAPDVWGRVAGQLSTWVSVGRGI